MPWRFADTTNSDTSTRSSARTGSAAGASHMHWPRHRDKSSTRADPHVLGEAILSRHLRFDRARERQPALEERMGDGLDQRLARGEVTVDGADADARATRHLLHAERRAVARVLVDRRFQHALAVPRGIDSLPAQRRRSPIARPASAGAMMLGSPSSSSNSWPSPSPGDSTARLAREGTSAAATPAPTSAIASTMKPSS